VKPRWTFAIRDGIIGEADRTSPGTASFVGRSRSGVGRAVVTFARLGGAAGIRPAEAGTIALVGGIFATIEAGRGVGEVGANALVVGRLTADALPYLYIPLGVISLIAALAYGAALGRITRARLFETILVGFAMLIVGERLAIALGLDGAVPVAWLTIFTAGAIAVTLVWTVASSTFDARQAKRLFPVCTAAAIGGNFVGALSAGPLAALIGTESLLIAEAGLFVAAAVLVSRLGAARPTPAWGPIRGPGRSILVDVRSGFDEVRRSRLMSLVAVAYVLLAVLLFSVNFPFLRAAETAFPSEAALAGAIGLISAIVTGASFIVSLVVANRFYARFGVATAALLLPVAYLVGFGIWIVQFSFVTAAVVQSAIQVTQRGLSNAAWSAFYNTVPAYRRAQVMAFQDGVPGQIGIVLSGVLLLTAARLLTPEQVFWLGAAVAAVAVAVVFAIRRRYASSLLATLRRGLGEQVLEGGNGIANLIDDPDVRRALVTALAAPEPRVREMAATMLAQTPGADTLDALRDALDDPEPIVRAAAAGAMMAHDAAHPDHVSRGTTTISAMLVDPDPRARTAALDALARIGRRPADDRLASLLADPEPSVRAAAIGVIAAPADDGGQGSGSSDPADATLDEARFLAGLSDPAEVVRRTAAQTLVTRPRLPTGLTALLEDPSPAVQAAAVQAMMGHGPEIRDSLVPWSTATVDRATFLATAVAAMSAPGAPSGPDAAFLADVLRGRRRLHEDLALEALAVLDVPEARGVIRRCLRSTDSDVRAQAIEMLDSMDERQLGGAIARLVEVGGATETDRDVIAALRHDDDPWIRTLSGRIGDEREPMAGDAASVGEIERMLELRRVPLFGRLEPEDLIRVAGVAEERSFETGAVIVREGELGDELFVILEGQVHVERLEPDGSTRHIRTYGPGDHFGELAVLLERPRVASVVADDPVRTLVIGGEGLTAILRERPDASMAMLATLAERISLQ
jgi:HEAT repeat protein